MAIATRTLKDTVVAGGKTGGKVTILVNFDDNTTANSNILDASGLDGHANGAKLDITRIWSVSYTHLTLPTNREV